MNNALTDDELRKSKQIANELEKRMHRMIAEANKILAQDGTQIGAEVTWFFGRLQKENDNDE